MRCLMEWRVMMMKNKVTLIGTIFGAVKHSTVGEDMSTAKVAFNFVTVDKIYKNDGSKESVKQYFPLVAYGKTAEMIHKYLTSNAEIAIEGKLVMKPAGSSTTMVVQISDFIVLGRRSWIY